jgi:lysophospholipase L1-like esterase
LVYNQGISGDTTEGYVKRFENETTLRLDDEEENIFIISGGENDASFILKSKKNRVSLKRFKRNVQKLIELSENIPLKSFSRDCVQPIKRKQTPFRGILRSLS